VSVSSAAISSYDSCILLSTLKKKYPCLSLVYYEKWISKSNETTNSSTPGIVGGGHDGEIKSGKSISSATISGFGCCILSVHPIVTNCINMPYRYSIKASPLFASIF